MPLGGLGLCSSALESFLREGGPGLGPNTRRKQRNVSGKAEDGVDGLARVELLRSQHNRLTFCELVTLATAITALLWAAGRGRFGRMQDRCRGYPRG